MNKPRFSLRFKLAAIVAGVMTVCCALLTGIALSSSEQMVAALPLQAAALPGEQPPQTAPQPAQQAVPAQIVSTAQSAFRAQNLCAMVAVVALGSAAAYWLVRRQLKPLEELTQAVRGMDAEHLDPAAVPIPRTQDESRQLAAALADMSGRVGRAYQMQKEFAASAAHELRTPLAAIQSRVEVFRMKERTAQEYEALLQSVCRNTQRLSLLTEQLMQLAAMQPGEREENISLAQLARSAARELEPLCEQRQVSIAVEGEARVSGNRCLLQRAAFNLMENAVKYNRPGGAVTVLLCAGGETARLAVEDTGPGIPPRALEHLFDAFYRVDASRSREMGGNGLGLAVVQRIARQHGGSVQAQQRSGGGSRFVLELPV